MYVSELRLYDFRQFKSVDGKPGLELRFHPGLNALVGENGSGKTTVVDAMRYVLLTQSGDGVMIQGYQNRRFDSDFLTMQKVISSGKLGELFEVEMHWDYYRPEVPEGADR